MLQFFLCLQGIETAHEASAQEGQTEVGLKFGDIRVHGTGQSTVEFLYFAHQALCACMCRSLASNNLYHIFFCHTPICLHF